MPYFMGTEKISSFIQNYIVFSNNLKKLCKHIVMQHGCV